MERMEEILTERELEIVLGGWSIKQDILGEPVLNDANDKIGVVDDVILTPDSFAAFAIIGVGGFLGLGKHDVAIPMQQLDVAADGFVLYGATKENLKAMPKFEYASDPH